MKIKIITTILLITLILSGCNTANQVPVVKDPVKGGELFIRLDTPIIDPIFTTNFSSSINNLTPFLYRGLLKYDESLHLKPDLAESFTFDQQNNQVEIILKDNLNWENNTPITLEDVQYTYEVYSDRSYNGYWKPYTLNIIGTDVFRTNRTGISGLKISQENNSITIQYNNLTAKDLELLTAPILSKQQLTNLSLEQIRELSKKGELYASGPFKVAEINQTEPKLIRNEEYEEEVFLDGIVISKNLEVLNYDVILAVPSEIKGNTIHTMKIALEGEGYEYLGMNLNKAEFKEPDTRKAIASIINYGEIINEIFNGYADRVLSPIHPKSWAYVEYGIPNETKDAKAIIANKNLKLQLAFEDTLKYQLLAERIAGKLAEYGVTIELVPIQKGQYIPRLFSKGEFDLFLASWKYEIDPIKENEKWLARNDVLLNGFNVSHVNDKVSDTFLQNAAMLVSEDERINYYEDWQKHFMSQYYIIPIASTQMIFLSKPETHISINNSLNPYSDIQNWWKEKSPEPK